MKDCNTSQIYFNHSTKSPFEGPGEWKLALLIFSGSLDFKVELNHLRTTVKKMQHDSTKYQISGLFGLVSGMRLFALQYPEIEEVIGFVPYDVNVNKGQIYFDSIYKANKPFL